MTTRWFRALALAFALPFSLTFPPALATLAQAERQPQFLRRPDIHGERVVFTSEGDLWLGSIKARTAMRVTSADGVETAAHFSPDGSRIAFTASYDGGTDVYVMDAGGGSPHRLTWDPSNAVVQGWSPDGASVLFRSGRNQAVWRNRLWSVPAAGGGARLLPLPSAEFASVHADVLMQETIIVPSVTSGG